MGSLLATHSLISPIKSEAIRHDLRLRSDYASVTDFGQLDDEMRQQQIVLYHEQNLDQLVDDLPADLIEAQMALIEEVGYSAVRPDPRKVHGTS